MELIGRYSNPTELLQTRPTPRSRRDNGSETPVRRRGAILSTITSVLAEAGRPLRLHEIQVLSEIELGQDLSRPTVKDVLFRHSRGPQPLFRRVRRGWYEQA
jgi:hypothetical protein